MDSKLRWMMLLLIVGSLLAGCNPTIKVVIMTPTPISTARVRVGPTSGQILPSSATPGRRPGRPASVTPAPTPTQAAGAPPAPALAPATATSTRLPIPTTHAEPTSTPKPASGAVITTPTAKVPANALSSFEITPGVALQVPRMWHTATRLSDGRILLVGGSRASDDFLADVEIFDPAIGQTRLVTPLHTPRHAHTATLLPDGRVLIVGGYSLPRQWLDDAEVYDPVADTWTAIPPPYPHSTDHTATLMKDGRVLVAGGSIGSGVGTERVDIFDPKTNTWTEARPFPSEIGALTAQLLQDGRVLIVGAVESRDAHPPEGKALLYDPQTNTWTATGPTVRPVWYRKSVLLADGRVLVAGGKDLASIPSPDYQVMASAEIYDPTSDTWTVAADLAQPRFGYDLVLLPDSQVLALGGARAGDCCRTSSSFVREIELYDPAANQWRIVGELPQPRGHATATLLPDGRVWVAGGRTTDDTAYLSDTWLIGPHMSAAASALPGGSDVLLQLHFDEPAGATVFQDSSPYGHDAWCERGACPTKADRGLDFNGQNTYLMSSASVQGLSSFTLAGWFYARSYEHAGKYPVTFWAPGKDCGRADLGIAGAYTGGWRLEVAHADDCILGREIARAPGGAVLNQWQHVVAVFDSDTDRHTIYINGQKAVENVYPIDPIPNTPAGQPMTIGVNPSPRPYDQRWWDGYIDDVVLYNRVLSASEVEALYRSGR